MQNLYSLFQSKKVIIVNSEQALQERYQLFQEPLNEKHAQQYYLLNKQYNGLYEQICKLLEKEKISMMILFYINEKDQKMSVYIQPQKQQNLMKFIPLSELYRLPKQKKVIYKVIHNQTQKEILLFPNDNIVQGRFSRSGIPIQIPSTIYYNGNNWFELNYVIEKHCVNVDAAIKQFQYYGEINDRLNPINNGYFKNPSLKIESNFQDGFYKSPIQITQFPDNRSITVVRNNEKTLLPICYHLNNLIDYYTFQTIFEGRWINQKVLDYYLYFANKEIMKLNKVIKTVKYQNYLINTCDSSDIFSSDIFEQLYHSEEFWKNYQVQHKIDVINDKNRFIFALNIGRSHFIVLVLEQNQKKEGAIYLLDSIPTNITDKQTDTGINNIKSLFPHLKIKQEIIRIQEIEHQKNGFDCGIHCIYNSLTALKEYNKSINEISFKIKDKQKISRLRRHIYYIMVNNYSHWFSY